MAYDSTTYSTAGIGARPAYDYVPPAGFFAQGAPTGADVFDIRDFGAVADAAVNNQPMIQAALDAAHAAGGGLVYVPAGVWGIAASPDGYGSLHVPGNVFLKGAGMGESALRLVDGSSGDITGLVRSTWGVETANWGVADLTIDGNMANTSGQVDGFFTGPQPGSTMTDKDVYVLRVEIEGVSRYGFDPHERTERLSIKDSVAHDNGVDGFVLDYVYDSEISGNVSYGNGRHGFNFVTTTHDVLAQGNVARDNGGAGFVIQRGSEAIDSPFNIVLSGGASYGNGREGVLVQMADAVTITGMEIHDNGRTGVRLYGSSLSVVHDNVIANNSQSLNDGYAEVDIIAYADSVTGTVYEATGNTISDNTITADGAVKSRFGIEERAGGTGDNTVLHNDISGSVRGPLSLKGEGSYVLKLGTDAGETISGGSSQDHILGEDGADTLSGQDGNDFIEGGLGNDTVSGGKGDDLVAGGEGDDNLNANSGNDTITGGAGNDTLIGDAGNDILEGQDGNDNVNGGSGNDLIYADAGDDTLIGGSGIDTLDFSGISNGVNVDLTARVATGAGSDSVSGFEAVAGSAFADTITGDKNANTLSGGTSDDTLRGMGGADVLFGEDGDDIFMWGAVRDVIDSGVHLGVDHIADFEAGDTIDVRALTGGADAASSIRVSDGTAGTTVAVKIGGTFHDVAVLDGVHGLSAEAMLAQGMILA